MNNTKMGRPRTDTPRMTQLGVRLSNDELVVLDVIAEEMAVKSRSEAIRQCILKVYESLPKNKK